MNELCFDLARPEHALAIHEMRSASAAELTSKLGSGPWNGSTQLASVRERINCADPEILRRATLFVALMQGLPVGSVVVSTYSPGFWKKQYWQIGNSGCLAVFNLVVLPKYQRQGIGSFLMKSVEELARTHEIAYVRLDAFKENPISTGFFRSIGYDERAVIDLRGTGLVLFEKAV
ncbi:MAG: GNAT family N-acetyltransferase [Armatimonadota bacterium]